MDNENKYVSAENWAKIIEEQIGVGTWPKTATMNVGGIKKGDVLTSIEHTLAKLLGYEYEYEEK